jgi:hypothetical protein
MAGGQASAGPRRPAPAEPRRARAPPGQVLRRDPQPIVRTAHRASAISQSPDRTTNSVSSVLLLSRGAYSHTPSALYGARPVPGAGTHQLARRQGPKDRQINKRFAVGLNEDKQERQPATTPRTPKMISRGQFCETSWVFGGSSVMGSVSGPKTKDPQMRWKFFSISRRVMRSTTGRPCGQTLEYAVRRSSSRMYRIFSIVKG